MRISFDFDGVLDTEKGQEFFRAISQANWLASPNGTPFQLFIITTRFEGGKNEDIWNFVLSIGGNIQVKFTEHEWKWKTIDELDIDVHIDDNPDECHLINEKCEKTHSMLFGLNIHKLLIEGTEL